jgi:hypothetical protein
MPCGKSAGAEARPRISLGSPRFCERILILGINFRDSVRVAELLNHNLKSKI